MTDVRMPDGTVIRNVPEGTTRAQLMARYGKHQQSSGGVMGTIGNVISSGNELLLGAVEGAYNAAAAVTDPIARRVLNLISPAQQNLSGLVAGRKSMGLGDTALQTANHQRRAVVNAAQQTFIPQANPLARTVGRVAGTMALPVPKIAGAGRLATFANRAVQGAVGGAGVREVDQSAVAPAAIGAAANVALPPILSKLAQTAPAQALLRVGSRAAADTVAPLGRQVQARLARFKALGIENPTTGMVTRDPAAFSFEQNVAKTDAGQELAHQMRGVEGKLVEKGRAMVRDLGGAHGPEATGKAVEDVLDTKRVEMQRVTSRLYDKVREARGDERIGNFDTLRQTFDQSEFADNPVFEDMTTAIGKRLGRYADRDPSVGFTVKQAEELRKFIGGLGNSADATARAARRQLIDALDDDVVGSVGDDAFKAARASAKARFDEFGKTFAGKLADERVAPELLTKRVLGDGVKLTDLRSLRRSLTTGTDEQIARGQEAWRGLQSQAVEDLLKGSVDADGNLIGNNLHRNFGKSATKFRELLGPDDFKTLRRLSAATRDVKSFPVGHSVNTSNTAATLANMFDNAPGKVKGGWVKFLLRHTTNGMAHVAAWSAAGPTGNLALYAGKSTLSGIGEAKAANALAQQIRMAQNPAQLAKAIKEAQAAAGSSAAVADFLSKAGLGRIIGGTAASQAQ